MDKVLTKDARTVMQKVVTSSSLIVVDGDVVTSYLNPNCEFNDESARENIDAIWELIKDERVFHLLVPDPTTHVTVETKDYLNPPFEALKKGEALIIKTLAHRLLAKFYLLARKDKQYPIRIFENEKDAMDWFNTLRLDANEG